MIWLWLCCAREPDPMDWIMARLDADGSGAIEASEASPLADFDQADADGDGEVDRDELRAYLDAFGASAVSAKGPPPEGDAAGPPGPPPGEGVEPPRRAGPRRPGPGEGPTPPGE